MIETDRALIPGLPDAVALDCIARIAHRFHARIRPVCSSWRDVVTAPSFLRHRERVGAAEDLVFLVQAIKGDDEMSRDLVTDGIIKVKVTAPKYSLAVYNATNTTWHRVWTPDPIPMFSQITAVDGKLILVGGWDPITLDPVADVRILDLSTMTWRRGSPMMSARSFFACAATRGRVYVAGGHDGQKNALRSAEAYNVATDEWVGLPPMREERDESRGLIVGGEFWAVSGYSTDNQGRFTTSAEVYDMDKDGWTTVEGALGNAMCASSLVRKGMKEFDGKEYWRAVGPASTSPCESVIGAGERIIVTIGEGNGMWMMELKSMKWVRVDRPIGFSGSVYSAVTVRI